MSRQRSARRRRSDPPPSINEVNSILTSFNPIARQYAVAPPERYKRGNEACSRIWVELACDEHGHYTSPVRLDSLIRQGGRCTECGIQRRGRQQRLDENEIRSRVLANARSLHMEIEVKEIRYVSGRRSKIVLNCKAHGEYTTTVDKAVNRSQLCRNCGMERLGDTKRILFDEKRRLYKLRYPDSNVELRKQLSKSDIEVLCKGCGRTFRASWTNIYHSRTKCLICGRKRGAAKRTRPEAEIRKEFDKQGLELLAGYVNTHSKCRIRCNTCLEEKSLKPKHILTRKKGISCKCTKSIPDYCCDVVASSLIKFDPEIMMETGQFLDTYGVIPDIYMPTKELLVEVKYGDSCFGRPNGTSMARKRHTHILKQYSGYLKLQQNIIYLIVARKKDLIHVPPFLASQVHYFLEDFNSFKVGRRRALTDTCISTLEKLYDAPAYIRGIEYSDSPYRKLVRERLFAYIRSHDGRYPSQKETCETFGYSQRVVDRALGLGRNANMKLRIEILRDIYGFEARAERRFYNDSSTVLTSKEEGSLGNYLRVCKEMGRLPDSGEVGSLGLSFNMIDRWLGIPSKSTQNERERAVRELGVEVRYVPLIKGLGALDADYYSKQCKIAQKHRHCVVCPNPADGKSPLCNRCHANAKRFYPGQKRAKRAISFIRDKAHVRVKKLGSDEFGDKIRVARRDKMPSSYRSLWEETDRVGCPLCDSPVGKHPLCGVHLQRYRQFCKIAKKSMKGAPFQEGMVKFVRSLQRDHATVRKWIRSGQTLKARYILEQLSDELWASYRWYGRYRDALQFIAENGKPTETPGKPGHRIAVWLNRTLREHSDLESIRLDLIRLLKIMRP